MSNDETPFCDPILNNKIANLPLHFQNGLFRESRIRLFFRGIGESLGNCRAPVFKVRKIDVDEAVKHLQGLHIFICIRIVYEGDCKAPFFCFTDRSRNMRYIGHRAYKVDIVATTGLKDKKDLYQLINGNFSSHHIVAYLIVLTKNTSEIAGRKKDVARSLCARNGRFLAEVRSIMGDNDLIACAAISLFTGEPVCPTTPGA